MDATILLVEDNEELNMLNRRALELAGYRVLTALTLAEARAHLEQNKPDVILLDVMLPDGDGAAFCGEIREGTDAHILFLTSKTGDEDHLRGLAAGGDDYIKKPYRMDLMLARVAAALRRREMAAGKAADKLRYGALMVDAVTGSASVDGEDALLTPKEFALLYLLLRNPGRAFTAEELYEAVWGQPAVGDVRTVRVRISNLRKKLRMERGDTVEIVLENRTHYRLEVKCQKRDMA